jgi:hypothetical protein
MQGRWHSTVGLAAIWTAMLSSVFHLGTVEHDVCEEHGEIVERPHHLSADTERADGDSENPATEAERHDHCPILAQQHHGRATPQLTPDAPPQAASADRVTPAAAATTARSAIALLRVAPKTSPPF